MEPRTRMLLRGATALAAVMALLLLGPVAGSFAAGTPSPHVATGGAKHVLFTSALVTGTVSPNGVPTSYYFEWGPTPAYGHKTALTSAGAVTTRVKVGQSLAPLLPGTVYHFRLVGVFGATNQTVAGADHAFVSKSTALKFELVKLPAITVGEPFIFSGMLTGQNAAHHAVSLQATPYPYLQPFATLGLPGLTDASGRFSFRVSGLLMSTEFRVTTLDSRPLYSSIEKVAAAVRVSLHAKRTRNVGVYRLYGTVSPASPGAEVLLQLRKKAPVGSKLGEKAAEEEESAFVFGTQFHATISHKRSAATHFSVIVHVRHAGLYRAYIKPPRGAFVAGSSATVRLRAMPPRKKHRARKTRHTRHHTRKKA